MRGTEPIAAALCKGSCPRTSFTLAVALWRSSLRATSRLFLETQKCSAVSSCQPAADLMIVMLFQYLAIEICANERLPDDDEVAILTLHIDACPFL